jgi:hypothetical protein
LIIIKSKTESEGIKMRVMNTEVTKNKNYSYHASQVINKLLASDQSLKLFFNILEPTIHKVNINLIREYLKELYPVNKDSIKDLNKLLSKYKIIIEDKPLTVNPYTLRPIKSNDVYMPKGYRQHSKPITIYNVKHLPTVI